MPIYPAQGPPGAPGASSSIYKYNFSTSTTPPPLSGQIITDSDPATSTTLYMHYQDISGTAIGPLLRTITNGDDLLIQQANDATKWVEYLVDGDPVADQAQGILTVPVTLVDISSPPIDKAYQGVSIFHSMVGTPGPAGPPGPAGTLSTSDKWATAQNFPYTVGRYYDGLIGITYATNQNFGANTLNLNPIYWHSDINVDQIGVNVTQAGTGYIRLAVYNCDPVTGLPTTLKFETANILANSTGAKTAAITQSFTAGWYYVALNSDSSIFLMGATYTATTVRYGFSAVADTYAGGGFTRTQTFGAMPTPAAMTTANITPFSYIPSVRFRIAA